MATVEKITISLTPEMAGFVRGAVDAGEYASTSEAIRRSTRMEGAARLARLHCRGSAQTGAGGYR